MALILRPSESCQHLLSQRIYDWCYCQTCEAKREWVRELDAENKLLAELMLAIQERPRAQG